MSGTNKLFWEIARFKQRFTRQVWSSWMRRGDGCEDVCGTAGKE